MTVVFDDTTTMIANFNTGDNQNWRMVYSPTVLSAASGAKQLRITIVFGPLGGPTPMGPLYVGQQGVTSPNFTGDQVQILFGGNPTVTPLAAGQTSVSDWATLAQNFDNTKTYVISGWNTTSCSDATGVDTSITGAAYWQEATTGSSTAAQTAPTNLTLQGSNFSITVTKIEAQAAPVTGSTLASIAAQRRIFKRPTRTYFNR